MGCAASGDASEPLKDEAPERRPKAVAPPAGAARRLCKHGCGCQVPNKLTPSGKPFDTCCRSCAKCNGAGEHDDTCLGPPDPSTVGGRPVCPKGSRCRNRDLSHLEEQAHPLDKDYAACCAATGAEEEPMSLKVLFDWTDADGSGKLSREELQRTLAVIADLSGWTDSPEDFPPITDAAWKHLDEDGNGVVNFNEFASWAGPRLGLPLGIRRASARKGSIGASPCSVLGCPCEAFEPDGKAEVDDDAVGAGGSLFCCGSSQQRADAQVFKTKCKHCKHKKCLHARTEQTGEVEFPDYWDALRGDFHNTIPMVGGAVADFQMLFDRTYGSAWTRDRKRHNPENPKVPKGFEVQRVFRNENSFIWREYYARRTEVLVRQEEASGGEGARIEVFDKVKTAVAWREILGEKAKGRLVPQCNEFYLLHGTSPEAAQSICTNDFKVSRAGANTGTLYGRGLYFAESITKADEYAKANDSGDFAVLFCRVLGGHVLYTDEPNPDPEELVYQCVEGPFDSVLGDREKCKGTYKEFVLFDSEDVYPEYIVEYRRTY